jgi:hypothetical protein
MRARLNPRPEVPVLLLEQEQVSVSMLLLEPKREPEPKRSPVQGQRQRQRVVPMWLPEPEWEQEPGVLPEQASVWAPQLSEAVVPRARAYPQREEVAWPALPLLDRAQAAHPFFVGRAVA